MSPSAKEKEIIPWWIKLAVTHPNELRAMVQYKIWREPSRDITKPSEFVTSRYDVPTMKKCWHFLDLTSRSFASVIKELDGDLARVVTIFYLCLRGLDTVEDDMTLEAGTKDKILREFHQKLDQPGWTFSGSGEAEEDRQLLVEFDNVITEYNLLSESCKVIIQDVTRKMGTGMADYATITSQNPEPNNTIGEYELYCHYVAGLVGEGLSRLYSACGFEDEALGEQLILSNHMGLFLQKTNIIRDYREDLDEKRGWWPKEIWARPGFKSLAELHQPGNEKRALHVVNEMVLNALRHAPACLDYLSLLKNQQVFSFCAIPQLMAISTLELCFMNPMLVQKNIKIRKGQAVRLILRATNCKEVSQIFRDYARLIHAKCPADDPNFLSISIACGEIEKWCELHFPSFVQIYGSKVQMNPMDSRTLTWKAQSQAQQLSTGVENTLVGQKSSAEYSDTVIYMAVIGSFVAVALLSVAMLGSAFYFFDS